jgi:hypothetical protein
MEYSGYDIINGTVKDLTQGHKKYTLSFIVLNTGVVEVSDCTLFQIVQVMARLII